MLLTIFFFTPWLTACGITLSGKDLAFGIDVGFGVNSGGAYPWLTIVPIAGLCAILLFFLSLNKPPEVQRKHGGLLLIVGLVATFVLVLVGIGLSGEAGEAAGGLVEVELQFGYIGSLIAGAMVIIGALLLMKSDRTVEPGAVPDYEQVSLSGGVAEYPLPVGPTNQAVSTARLIAAHGPLAGQTLSLTSSNLLLGRSSQCDIRIPDSSVSRHHAHLRLADGTWFIQDDDSLGGILLNGQSVRAARLASGDQIQVGNSLFTFYE